MNIKEIDINQCVYFPVKERRWKYPRIYSGCVRKIVIESAPEGSRADLVTQHVYIATDCQWFVRDPKDVYPTLESAEVWRAVRVAQIHVFSDLSRKDKRRWARASKKRFTPVSRKVRTKNGTTNGC